LSSVFLKVFPKNTEVDYYSEHNEKFLPPSVVANGDVQSSLGSRAIERGPRARDGCTRVVNKMVSQFIRLKKYKKSACAAIRKMLTRKKQVGVPLKMLPDFPLQ